MRHTLFTYGTLCLPEVMQAVTGRVFPAQPGRLSGYRCRLLRRRVYPGLVAEAGASTAGVLHFGIDATSLARLDEFESEVYRHQVVRVTAADGGEVEAIAYLLQDASRHLLGERDWDEAAFRRRYLRDYLRRIVSGD